MHLIPKTHVYKRVAGCQIKADVYPATTRSRRAPTIVFIHGGALIYGSRRGINPTQLELYTLAGYTVISIDYRLAPESKLPAIIEDVQDAIRWVRRAVQDAVSVDPKRLAIVGHSAGGYLTLMAGCSVWPRPDALVSFYGYGDIVGDWYSKPDPFYCQQPGVSEEESSRHIIGPVVSEPYEGRGRDKLYLYLRQRGLWPLEVGGHDPVKEPSFFAPYCPLRNIPPDYPPTLLLHGDRDTDVPYEQSVLMTEALAHHNVEHSLITVEGGGHGFDHDMDDPVVHDAFRRVLAFLEAHLG